MCLDSSTWFALRMSAFSRLSTTDSSKLLLPTTWSKLEKSHTDRDVTESSHSAAISLNSQEP